VRRATKLRLASEAGAASARSRLYLLLARSFAFPEPDFHREALEGELAHRISEAAAGLPYPLVVGSGWRPAGDYESFQSEYVRLFEVGPRGRAPCPLHSGHYTRDRLRTMEELVHFYNYFGLRTTPGLMPDHFTAELEFMHYLAHKEAEALEDSGDVDSFRRAERDFLERRLLSWWPTAAAAVGRQRPQQFYRSLTSLTRRFLTAERSHLSSALRRSGGVP
jgi:DMSO reductase family type II enzyme chaperone